MKKLHILFQHGSDGLPYGCSMIRLLRPLSYPGLHMPYTVTWGTDLPPHPVDVVIVERLWKPDTTVQQAQALVQAVRAQGARLLYTLDDDLLGLPLPGNALNAVRLFARHADGLIVSTAPLAERMRGLNANCVVVPNQIDDTLFGPSPDLALEDRRPVVMGYMGTPTHLHDLLGILAPLRSQLRRHAGQVCLELVGVAESPAITGLFEGLPVRIKRPEGHVAYDRFVPWMKRELRWDFALAPLSVSPFNRCKSDLKFLDYGALGIPGIFSDVTPYKETVQHGVNGLLAAGHSGWEACLEQMITEPEKRGSLAAAARDHVFTERCLRVHATDWVEAVARLLQAA